jgi:hypothetical protein
MMHGPSWEAATHLVKEANSVFNGVHHCSLSQGRWSSPDLHASFLWQIWMLSFLTYVLNVVHFPSVSLLKFSTHYSSPCFSWTPLHPSFLTSTVCPNKIWSEVQNSNSQEVQKIFPFLMDSDQPSIQWVMTILCWSKAVPRWRHGAVSPLRHIPSWCAASINTCTTLRSASLCLFHKSTNWTFYSKVQRKFSLIMTVITCFYKHKLRSYDSVKIHYLM